MTRATIASAMHTRMRVPTRVVQVRVPVQTMAGGGRTQTRRATRVRFGPERSSGRYERWERSQERNCERFRIAYGGFQIGRIAADRANIAYEVKVVTGSAKGAGTDANVFLTVNGEYGTSGRRALKKRFRDLFERAQHDSFVIECSDLGTYCDGSAKLILSSAESAKASRLQTKALLTNY